MADLWTKVNALLRARVERFLEDDLHLPLGGRSDRLGRNIDGEIAALRQQIDSALDREEQLEAQIAALRQEAATWDAQADNALLQGDEATARYALGQMQNVERRTTLLEADLSQHRRNTADFITRVNMLEGLVAEARRREEAAPPEPAPAMASTLDSVLQTARQEIETLEAEEARLEPVQVKVPVRAQPAEKAEAPGSIEVPVEAQVNQEIERIQVEDELAARRARLARRETQADP